ncbi:MAG: deoxynucleoside kinase [Saprospiraceae bacterium]|nr:deoxynucleoside kinase [Saprospiraceae bacterium]
MEVSEKHPIQHRFIAIEGNIGAGKTTFSKMLSRDFSCELVLEQFTDNPFLPYFYEHPERYAFPVELFFMTERHKQLQEHFGQPSLFGRTTISDYFFVKTLLFARNNLNEEEFRLFQRLFNVLNNQFPNPDLLVYLYRPVDDLLKNIRRRGRAYELDIKPDYLESIQKAYLSYFRNLSKTPVLILDISGISFWEDSLAYKKMVQVIQKSYPPGYHQISL